MKFLLFVFTFMISLSCLAQPGAREFKNRTLFQIHELSPNACDHPYNFPYFYSWQELANQKYSGYFHIDTNSTLLNGRFKAIRKIETEYTDQRETIRLKYENGALNGLCTFTLEERVGEYKVDEKIELWYEDGECLKARYTNFDLYGEPDQKKVVEEILPMRQQLVYFQILADILTKEDHPAQLTESY